MKILFIAPLPPPTTGQSLACQVFLDALRPEHEVEVVNLARSALGRGEGAASRVRQVLRLVRQTARKAAACDTVYFTVSQSVAGNLKDVFFNISEIASDLEFRGSVAAPTIRIDGLTVGGE